MFLLHRGGSKVLAQLVVLDSQTEQEGNTHEGNADGESLVEGDHEDVENLSLGRVIKLVHRIRVCEDNSNLGVHEEQGLNIGLDGIVEDGSGDGDSKDGADGTEEGRVGGGDGNVGSRDRGLDGEHDGLHRETETAAVDEQEADDHTAGRVLLQEDQETGTDCGEGKADPDEGAILAPLGDHEARRD